jgi:hypothetical protein
MSFASVDGAFAMKTIWCILPLAVAVDAATYSVKAAVSSHESDPAQIAVSGFGAAHSDQFNGGTYQ